jgi:phosphoribosylamine-glycine ligase
MSVLLVGNGGREAAIADRLAAEGQAVHVAAEFRNPSLVHAAEVSEGQFYQIDSVSDPRRIAEVAVASRADLVWINQDDALANGAIDEIRHHAPDMAVASPTREGSRIEWDKFYGRQIMSEIDNE